MRHEEAEALEVLLSLLRSGMTPRQALLQWPLEAEERHRSSLAGVARRISLGASLEEAISSASRLLGSDLDIVVAIVSIHRKTGASLVEMLSQTIDSIRARYEAEGAAGAGSAGARMSARLVAGLPLAFVPLMPASKASLLDRPGSAFLILGVGLCLVGLKWISSLIPKPPSDDEGGSLAEWLACVLRAGGDLRTGMMAAVEAAPKALRPELEAVRRRVALGASWSRALELSDNEALRALGKRLHRSYRLGIPASDALAEFARQRRLKLKHRFDGALKRAPVAMVLPLTLCVLPAYALLGLAPFVRGISL